MNQQYKCPKTEVVKPELLCNGLGMDLLMFILTNTNYSIPSIGKTEPFQFLIAWFKLQL